MTDLSAFKKAMADMVATNDAAYSYGWGGEDARLARMRSKNYTEEEILHIVNSGNLLEQQKLSVDFFVKDGLYKRIIIYYATLLKYSGILIPNLSFGTNLSKEYIQKRYFSAVDFIDRASLQNLFLNCSYKALVNGVYYGVIQTLNKNDFTVLDLPTRYCRTRFKDLKGNDIIEFNVTYFNTIADPQQRKDALDIYPKVISQAYNRYQKGKGNPYSKWVLVPSEVGICFPFFDGTPPFLSAIPAIVQYGKAVDIELARALEEIRKVLIQKVPHLNDGSLLFEPDEAEVMHKGTVKMMGRNEYISILTTYCDTDAIVSKTASENTANSLDAILQSAYSSAGVSKFMFATDSASSLAYSTKNDLAFMMPLAYKYSNFMTNIINGLYGNSNINFKFSILPISYYNEKEYVEQGFKLASMGYSFLLPAMAMGLSQKDLSNVKDLENDLLRLRDKLLPLSTAYTQSNSGGSEDKNNDAKTVEVKEKTSDQVGAEEKPDEEKAESTIASEESRSNQ